MNLDTQAAYLNIINDDFELMKAMLGRIQEKIIEYPVSTQLEFIKPLQRLIFLAWQDAIDPDNIFLTTFDGGDKIEI